MKNSTSSVVVIAALLTLGTLSSRADDLFQLFWQGTSYQHDSSGHITSSSFSEQDIVNNVAQAHNLNPGGLVLVFRPNQGDAAVVRSGNGALVAQVFKFQVNGAGQTDVANPAGTLIMRSALLWDQSHGSPVGSFFGSETRQLNSSGGISSDQLSGNAFYAIPEQKKVFKVHVSTGGRV
jgi:hypothetical protein